MSVEGEWISQSPKRYAYVPACSGNRMLALCLSKHIVYENSNSIERKKHWLVESEIEADNGRLGLGNFNLVP